MICRTFGASRGRENAKKRRKTAANRQKKLNTPASAVTVAGPSGPRCALSPPLTFAETRKGPLKPSRKIDIRRHRPSLRALNAPTGRTRDATPRSGLAQGCPLSRLRFAPIVDSTAAPFTHTTDVDSAANPVDSGADREPNRSLVFK